MNLRNGCYYTYDYLDFISLGFELDAVSFDNTQVWKDNE